MGIAEKIKDIEIEMARTQKNKATEYHIGLLRARLCKLRSMAAEGAAKAAAPSSGGGFDWGNFFCNYCLFCIHSSYWQKLAVAS